MDLKQTVMGIVLFIVFWAFQGGYFNSLGAAAWFVGSIIFVVILWVIGKFAMPNPSAEIKDLWMFVTIFAIVATFMISFTGPYLGAVLPADPSQLTPLVLSFWLIIFGGALFVTGHADQKWNVTAVIGLIWLFSSLHFVTAVSTGPNSYLHFGLITGLSFIIGGIVAKQQAK